MTETKFPTEIVDLPSKGHFYPEDNPLSSGKIELRYMTARDEDILTSVNLIEQGDLIKKIRILRNCNLLILQLFFRFLTVYFLIFDCYIIAFSPFL